MIKTQIYITDVLNLVPDEALCFIQAPDIEVPDFLHLMAPSSYEYYKQLNLSNANKKLLIELVKKENIQEDFQSIEIKFNDLLLFKGYDGMEYGTISKNLILSDKFVEDYINHDMCIVSNEW